VGPVAVAIAIGLKMIMDGGNYFANPGWTALTADIVPLAWRGRFFGNRNMAMGVANMLVVLLAGQIITSMDSSLHGYQAMYVLAALFGFGASFCFAHIQEPHAQPKAAAAPASVDKTAVAASELPKDGNEVALAASELPASELPADGSEVALPGSEAAAEESAAPAARREGRFSFAELWQILRSDRVFSMYIIAQMVWNFGLMVAGPFFTVFQVEVLQSNAFIIGAQGIITALAGLPAQQFFGRLNDRLGPRRVVLLTGFLIPLLPLGWCFVRTPWEPTILSIFGGFIWAGYNLANFNMMLTITDPTRRPRYTAMYQISLLIASALGSALGSLVITQLGYITIFIISFFGRVAGAVLMLYLVKPRK
jgi:MFS family permease